MIGAFTAFGVGVQAAVVAVLAYRAFSFWLPTLPGAVAYFQLRRTVRGWESRDTAATVGGSGGRDDLTIASPTSYLYLVK